MGELQEIGESSSTLILAIGMPTGSARRRLRWKHAAPAPQAGLRGKPDHRLLSAEGAVRAPCKSDTCVLHGFPKPVQLLPRHRRSISRFNVRR